MGTSGRLSVHLPHDDIVMPDELRAARTRAGYARNLVAPVVRLPPEVRDVLLAVAPELPPDDDLRGRVRLDATMPKGRYPALMASSRVWKRALQAPQP